MAAPSTFWKAKESILWTSARWWPLRPVVEAVPLLPREPLQPLHAVSNGAGSISPSAWRWTTSWNGSRSFNESWRIMKNRFYDARMHGVDWARARAVYEPLMEYVADKEEMHNVVSQMIGELNASHTGISATPGPEERDHIVQTRFPGFELESDASGYYKVSYVYKDGPADKDYVQVNAGDYILAVDGHPLKAGENYWKYFTAVQGEKMQFLVNSKPGTEGAWLAKVQPVSNAAYTTLQYKRWVQRRKEIVDKASNGEIGYLHIRQMNAESLRQFERDLV